MIDKISEIRHALIKYFQTGLNYVKNKINIIISKPSKTENALGESSVPDLQSRSTPKSAPSKKPGKIRRHSKQRVYRLIGYTTVAKINRKRQSERQQRLLRRLLVGIIILLVIILLFNIYNPFRDLSEWYRIIGMNELSGLTTSNTSQTGTTASTAATTVTTATSKAK